MEISYKRRLSQSFMMIEVNECSEGLPDLNMMIHNRIPGFLSLEQELVDGKTRYWYDITGKQCLGDCLLRKSVDSELLRRLLPSMEALWEEICNYMLEEEGLVLGMDQIFTDFEEEKWYFTYLPGKKGNPKDELRRLLESLLQKLNHGDAEAVSIAYEMHQLSLQGSLSFSEMLKRIYGKLAKNGMLAKSSEEPEEKSTVFMEEERPLPIKRDSKPKKSHILGVLSSAKASIQFHKSNQFHKPKEYEAYLEPEEDEQEPLHPTEYLGKAGMGAVGRLLYQGRGKQADFELKDLPFVIGKKKNEVNGFIQADGVSRIHAIVQEEQGSYYIEDFNSTNGTFVNGERLEYRQSLALKPRDYVSFGGEEYLFL